MTSVLRIALAAALGGALAGCASSPARSAAYTRYGAPHVANNASAAPASTAPTPQAPIALCIPGPVPLDGDPKHRRPTAILADGADGAVTLPPLRPTDLSAADKPLQVLYSKAAAKWASIDDYGCRMRRREVVQGRARPEEVIIAKFRKDPFSVHFEWVGQEGKGREMVYVQGQHGNLLHTLTAAGDVPLLPGGQRFKVSPDSMLVKAASRSSITDAGVGSLIERFGKLVADFERGDPRASAKYLGRMKRPEFENHVDVVVQKIPAGAEPTLPGGGQRLWCFDPGHGLPVLVVTHDHLDREVDFVCFDRFEFPGRYLDEVFHPDYLGKKLITGSR